MTSSDLTGGWTRIYRWIVVGKKGGGEDLHVSSGHDVLAEEASPRPDGLGVARAAGQGAHRAAQQPEGGPPVRGAVLVLVAVVEGVEEGEEGGGGGGGGGRRRRRRRREGLLVVGEGGGGGFHEGLEG